MFCGKNRMRTAWSLLTAPTKGLKCGKGMGLKKAPIKEYRKNEGKRTTIHTNHSSTNHQPICLKLPQASTYLWRAWRADGALKDAERLRHPRPAVTAVAKGVILSRRMKPGRALGWAGAKRTPATSATSHRLSCRAPSNPPCVGTVGGVSRRRGGPPAVRRGRTQHGSRIGMKRVFGQKGVPMPWVDLFLGGGGSLVVDH